MEKLENWVEDLENIVLKNILTDEEIKDVYETINNTPEDKTRVQDRIGHKAFLTGLPEHVRLKMEKTVQDIYGKEWVLEAYQFARYSLDYGYVPKLYPHYDDAFDVHRLTLDVQVYGTKPWPLVVEGRSFTLEDNEALIFSGTGQIHWREPIDFTADDQFDMIFCHFHKINDETSGVTQEWLDHMSSKMDYWVKEVGIETAALKVE
jgi:hypothetical protein